MLFGADVGVGAVDGGVALGSVGVDVDVGADAGFGVGDGVGVGAGAGVTNPVTIFTAEEEVSSNELSAAYTTALVVPAGTLKSVGSVIFASVNEVMLPLDVSYDAMETYVIPLTGVTCSVMLETLLTVTMPPPEETWGKLKFP